MSDAKETTMFDRLREAQQEMAAQNIKMAERARESRAALAAVYRQDSSSAQWNPDHQAIDLDHDDTSLTEADECYVSDLKDNDYSTVMLRSFIVGAVTGGAIIGIVSLLLHG